MKIIKQNDGKQSIQITKAEWIQMGSMFKKSFTNDPYKPEKPFSMPDYANNLLHNISQLQTSGPQVEPSDPEAQGGNEKEVLAAVEEISNILSTKLHLDQAKIDNIKGYLLDLI